MTGLLASKHGVTSNPAKLRVPTIFPALHDAEVKTGLVGKYLNSHNGKRLPEFDYWASFRGGNVRNWLQPRMNINGRFRTVNSYISDIVLEHSKTFTSRYAAEPYVLYMNFTAPHRPAVTPSEFPRVCSAVQLPVEFNSIDTTAPTKYQKLPGLNSERVLQYACDRATSLAYLDQKVSSFVSELVNDGVTVIIVSDNGVMLGEYRMREKAYPYPQVTRSPFLVFNYPRIEPSRMISLVDIPATIVKTYGVTPASQPLDGIALDEPRTSAIIEHFGSTRRIPFTAIATPGLINVTYRGGFEQSIRY
jgi:arylsulfatase A-like enzyme